MKILVLNSGSSSIKYALFEMKNKTALVTGVIERITEDESRHHYYCVTSGKHTLNNMIKTHQHGLAVIFETLSALAVLKNPDELLCIAHRVVHGGEHFYQPTRITQAVLAEIAKMSVLAPLHNPANITGIEAAMDYDECVPQVAIFDTAFHQTMPDYAYQYAVPHEWYLNKGVRRYGFHGTSHLYVAKQAALYLIKPLESLNILSLHLGNGASITAIEKGKSIDTSMGMTPLEGLVMGTRSGDLDAGIFFYLNRLGFSYEKIEQALNKGSGLKGICGENDMRVVQNMAATGNNLALLALAMYSYRLKKYIGAYAAILGRIDVVIFTGGIGENSALVRAQCCENLMILGIDIDGVKNSKRESDLHDISSVDSKVKILVITTNEELEIAEQAQELLS